MLLCVHTSSTSGELPWRHFCINNCSMAKFYYTLCFLKGEDEALSVEMATEAAASLASVRGGGGDGGVPLAVVAVADGPVLGGGVLGANRLGGVGGVRAAAAVRGGARVGAVADRRG